MAKRIIPLDYLRAFIVVTVVLHHSVIAYSPYAHFDSSHYLWGAPIVDSRRWSGFDLLALFNDIYFMSMMFFLSGLFVWPSLKHKGIREYVRGRVVRLGLPFALTVTFLMPLAYYPSFRMTGNDPGFLSFWRECFSSDHWPSGPVWFIWLLLVFDVAAATLFKLAPRLGETLHRVAAPMLERPALFVGYLVAVSGVAYLSMLIAFGPTRWFTFGPFSVQASRLLLYAVYFCAGIAAGAYGIDRGLLAGNGKLARRWKIWMLSAAASYVLIVMLEVFRQKLVAMSPIVFRAVYGLAFPLACGAIGVGVLALFLRFLNARVRAYDSLRDSAYGIYLIHYAFVIWFQYELLNAPLSPVLKAMLVFLGALTISWGIVAALRRIPVVAGVI